MTSEEKLSLNGGHMYNALRDGGYAKGYGSGLVRVMDKDHNPLFNCPMSDMKYLLAKEAARKDGLVYVFNKEIKI